MNPAPPAVRRSCRLSPAQSAIWLHAQVSTEPGLYVEHVCYDIRGGIDERRIGEAVRGALAAHPVFGAAITTDGGVPQLTPGRFVIDPQLRPIAEDDVGAVLAEESIRGFSLEEGPLSRCVIFRAAPDRLILLVVWHHIVTDGIGVRLFLRAVARRLQGTPDAPGSDIRSANESLAALATSEDIRDRADRIADRLRDLDPVPLPRRPEAPDRSSCVVVGEHDGAMPGLAAAARAARVTVPMMVSAAFQRAVGEILGLREFLLGCVTTGRATVESIEAVGCFVNTVLLRGNGDPSLPAADLLRSSAVELAAAVGDQGVPFAAVAARLLRGVRPRPIAFPQVYLSMDEPLPLELPGLDCRRRWLRHAQAKFDVAFVVEFTADGVHGVLHHRPAVLTPADARRLTGAFLTCLRAFVAAGPALRRPQPDVGRPAGPTNQIPQVKR